MTGVQTCALPISDHCLPVHRHLGVDSVLLLIEKADAAEPIHHIVEDMLLKPEGHWDGLSGEHIEMLSHMPGQVNAPL